MDILEITPEFRQFVENLIRYRCRLKASTFEKYIDTPESWAILRQAFVHKSLEVANYELLEFEGDVVLNLAVVEYIRGKFPKIVNVSWNHSIKHNLISKKTLAEVAIRNGFTQHIAVSDQFKQRIDRFEDPTECRDYLDMNEDTVEALCGAISSILNSHLPRGVGYSACYNLVASFLDEIEISTTYEDVFDAKSRMKILFDAQGWNKIPGCNLGECLRLYNLQEEDMVRRKIPQGPKRNPRDVAMNAYIRSLPNGEKPDRAILETEDRFLVLGYACVRGDPRGKVLLSVITGNKKTMVEQTAAEEVINKLRRKGIWLPPTDPTKRTG